MRRRKCRKEHQRLERRLELNICAAEDADVCHSIRRKENVQRAVSEKRRRCEASTGWQGISDEFEKSKHSNRKNTNLEKIRKSDSLYGPIAQHG